LSAKKKKKTGMRPLPTTRSQSGPYSLEEDLARSLGRRPGVIITSSAARNPYDTRQLVIRMTPKQYVAFTKTRAAAKTKYVPWESVAEQESYSGMNKYYREYRRDSLVRTCINTLAFWSTNKGFETVLEPTGDVKAEELEKYLEPYQEVKAFVDKINRNVGLDQALRVAVIKAKIYGHSAFEIVLNKSGEPNQLIPLDSTGIKADIDENWQLTGYTYDKLDVSEGPYQPREILYFANNALDLDRIGLSDIEPIIEAIQTRQKIIREDMKEAAYTLWAGIGIHILDDEGLDDQQVATAIEQHIKQLKPGKHVATSNRWSIQIVDLKPNLDMLINDKKEHDREIIGHFLVPRFMLNREEQVNRATAFAELQALVDGPITDIQRWLARDVEAQWYEPLVRMNLSLAQDQEPPVRIKHKWNPISTQDMMEWAKIVAELYAEGMGVIDRKKAYELMNWDVKELEQAQAAAQPQSTPQSFEEMSLTPPPVEETRAEKEKKQAEEADIRHEKRDLLRVLRKRLTGEK